ncbi:endonuclease domain-containing protein [Alicyclobacillus fastidiosus]|uniref:DUF559 domain-containing protein n=1 Tax=Alicyclobacillus fastidiosus TaxID=392011 RepID=A0ABV5AKN9_9BACL|nr:DUF559 domain-containing protein [Alicyclobacillus fastidiosus]WEH09303.1 DUF559 domain-containing protein [Alicyclobacillus fastidiosus]
MENYATFIVPLEGKDSFEIAKSSYQRADEIEAESQKEVADFIQAFICRELGDTYLKLWRVLRDAESPIELVTYLRLIRWEPYVESSDRQPPIIIAQRQIGKYRVDFTVEYDEHKWVIECDGHEFHEKTKEQAARDKQRDRYLQAEGYTVVHFTGSEIWKNPDCITEYLNDVLCPELRRKE